MSAAPSDGERLDAAREEACDRICDVLGWHVDDLVQGEADAHGDVWVTVKVCVPRHEVDARAVRVRGATAQPAQVTGGTAVTLVDACVVSADGELLAGATPMGGESLRVPANTESLTIDGAKYVRQPDMWSRSNEIVFAPAVEDARHG